MLCAVSRKVKWHLFRNQTKTLKMKVEFSAVNSHAHRQCHPETCCCSTDWLVVRFEYDRCGHITRGEIYDNCETRNLAQDTCDALNLNLKNQTP